MDHTVVFASSSRLSSYFDLIVQDHPHLPRLNLTGMAIDDEDVETRALMIEIKPLNSFILSHNDIGDDGASLIAKSLYFKRTLTILDLANNLIADMGAEKITIILMINSRIPTASMLHELNLNMNLIGQIGACYLATAIEEKTLALREP